jgi:hypothetical protein
VRGPERHSAATTRAARIGAAMLVSTMALAMGLLLLMAARLSGNPIAYGFVVLVGILLVALSCAMHLGAVLDRLYESAAALRVGAKLGVWLLVGGGTAWLIGRAPGDEVLFGLMIVPPAVGIAGVAVAQDERWPAAAYLAITGILTVLIVWVWLDDRLAYPTDADRPAWNAGAQRVMLQYDAPAS